MQPPLILFHEQKEQRNEKEENGGSQRDVIEKKDREPAIQYLRKDLVELRCEGKRY